MPPYLEVTYPFLPWFTSLVVTEVVECFVCLCLAENQREVCCEHQCR